MNASTFPYLPAHPSRLSSHLRHVRFLLDLMYPAYHTIIALILPFLSLVTNPVFPSSVCAVMTISLTLSSMLSLLSWV